MAVLANLVQVFASTVLPVFLVAGAGYILARSIHLDGRTLGRVIFFLASPSLVFRSLYTLEISTAVLQQELIIAFSIFAITAVAGWLAAAGQSPERRAALTLTSSISNNGNMGLPITLFALGEGALGLATVYYAVSAFMTNTFGVFVASSGSAPPIKALQQSLRAPVLYAALFGLLLNRFAVPVPDSVFRAVDLMADAAIPCMLVLLGIQLSVTPINRDQLVVWRSMAIRLVLSPLLALLLCLLLGVTGLERQVFILQAAMPTAVVTTVLATEFAAAPRLVAAAVLLSTLASMATISIVLVLLV
ncbi:MAG: AEC family transporter [Caldilineaceae bacterium]|nr:AEC family transporter [Caldilinea sp.]MCB0053899.1 AEC family transporter [Caldilinea sp.]MCB0134717.1 AEC family transporter [Caldilineaceae bacterium]HRW47633.1 AEC family transporter [Caldilinea sp.]